MSAAYPPTRSGCHHIRWRTEAVKFLIMQFSTTLILSLRFEYSSNKPFLTQPRTLCFLSVKRPVLVTYKHGTCSSLRLYIHLFIHSFIHSFINGSRLFVGSRFLLQFRSIFYTSPVQRGARDIFFWRPPQAHKIEPIFNFNSHCKTRKCQFSH
jgi:hypothetical protein